MKNANKPLMEIGVGKRGIFRQKTWEIRSQSEERTLKINVNKNPRVFGQNDNLGFGVTKGQNLNEIRFQNHLDNKND